MCHYTCQECGFAENCHDMPHIINENKEDKNENS